MKSIQELSDNGGIVDVSVDPLARHPGGVLAGRPKMEVVRAALATEQEVERELDMGRGLGG
ncbi:hypothetical protein K5M56_03015, partial [Serratia marcescens]|nr:hypothetical protein [Serratia marcescens]